MTASGNTGRGAAADFPPAVLRPAGLPAYSRGGGARTIPLVTR
jgi:hypothetical protein